VYRKCWFDLISIGGRRGAEGQEEEEEQKEEEQRVGANTLRPFRVSPLLDVASQIDDGQLPLQLP